MPWTQQVQASREAGYSAVESFGWGWDTVNDDDIREIRQACLEFDVEFYTLHLWANIIHPDPGTRDKIHRLHISTIEAAERLSMKYILTHTGGRDGDDKDKPHPQNHTRETWEMSVAGRVAEPSPWAPRGCPAGR
ncbi:MAG: TIM barrel protein [Candidatus Latescibacterota bacterium]